MVKDKIITPESIKQILNSGTTYYDFSKRRKLNGSNYFYIRVNGNLRPEHVAMWKLCNGSIPKGYVIHHIDGNKDNNNIINLKMLKNSEHIKLHCKQRRLS